MASVIAMSTGRHEVISRIAAPVRLCLEVLDGALQEASLRLAKAEWLGQFLWHVQPGWKAAVIAATTLLQVNALACLAGRRFRHRGLQVCEWVPAVPERAMAGIGA